MRLCNNPRCVYIKLPTLLWFLGDAKFNLPNLLPLKVPQININSKDSLSMQFTDCELHGLESSVVTGMHVDFKEQKTTLEVDIAHLNVLANYNISGRILILPVVGQGPANITIGNYIT